MSQDGLHDEVRDAVAAAALGILSPAERERVLAHAAECAECGPELAELAETAASLAHLAPPAAMDAERSARLRARLVARAAPDRGAPPAASLSAATPGEDDGGDTTLLAPPPPRLMEAESAVPARSTPVIPIGEARGGGRGGWLPAAAAVLLLLAVGGYALSLRSRVAEMDGQLAAADRERVELKDVLAQRETTLAGLTASSTRVIELASTGARKPSGRMFWNHATNSWTFFAHDLPTVRAGREYELWLITAAKKIPAGTFKVDPSGHGVVEAKYALSPDSLRAVAVTEEPAGGLPEPTGAPVLVGAAAAAR